MEMKEWAAAASNGRKLILSSKFQLIENSSKVLFYQLKNIQDTKALFSSSTVNANPGEMIGQVNLQ